MISRVLALLAVITATLTFVSATSAAPFPHDPDCPDGFSCGTVKVPLDWTGKTKGKLELPIQIGDGKGPVLVFLGGGPGQGFLRFGAHIQVLIKQLRTGYRVLVLDQRGTGANAINCKPLQSLVLTDFTVRPRSVVRSCGNQLGRSRAFYSTGSTVRDLEAIRKAIGVKKMAIMGTSYGTYVAEHFARRYPGRVSRLILDSVVPQENVDPFLRVHMRRAAFVLRSVCGNGKCGFKGDPARHLARLIARPPYRGRVPIPGKNIKLTVKGATVLDWLTTIASFRQQDIPDAARAIRHAARGQYRDLLALGYEARSFSGRSAADELSWGLHAATLCSDLKLPFSIAWKSRARRLAAANRRLAKIPHRSFWPFNRATGRANGILQACLDWPGTRVEVPRKPGRIKVPELILAGQYDLSTPIAYAKRELRRAPRGKLVVVPEVGHSMALSGTCADKAIASFLKGKPVGNPCRNAGARATTAGPWTSLADQLLAGR